jgi:acetoin utilization deacetylase AcuC-like enzyme
VTALALREEGFGAVGILDCDMHYGDGTEDILEHVEDRSFVRHFTAGDAYEEPSQPRRSW